MRVIAATNLDLEQAIRGGAFREDLYYRINLIRVRVPSLAERASDVPLLATHFLERGAVFHGRRGATFEPGALDWLADQPWPGNIRQLERVVERALLPGASDRIGVDDIWRTLAIDVGPGRDAPLPSLGMSRPALYRRLENYGIEA